MESDFLCPTPTPEVQLDHFLHHTQKFGIPVEMVQFHTKKILFETEHSCFVPSLLLSVRCYKLGNSQTSSTYVKESEILERSELESDILSPTSQLCLHVRYY